MRFNAFRIILTLSCLAATCSSSAQHYDTLIRGQDTIVIALPDIPQNVRLTRGQCHAPIFKDGDISDYIRKYLVYPEEAREKGISGAVRLYIIINEEGLLAEDPILIRGIHPALDREAIRLVQTMHWIPATMANENIPYTLYLDIPFQ